MADFTINGVAYQSRMLDGEVQTLVLKRMLPTFTALLEIADDLGAPMDPESGETAHQRMARLASPVAEKLAAISDADVKFILDACMDVTSRQLSTGVGWASIRQRGMIQDKDDAKFVTRLTIARNVLVENFGEMFASMGLDVSVLGMLQQGG